MSIDGSALIDPAKAIASAAGEQFVEVSDRNFDVQHTAGARGDRCRRTTASGRARSLAIDGGMPSRSIPFPPWPNFDEDEIAAVSQVLRSGHVNCWVGDQVREFEREFADYVGVPYAIALANGTVALELALRALGVGPGDEVVVPARTFVATASSVVMCGATPIFADIDEVSQNLTVDTVRAVLTPRTRALVPVHLAGWPCDMAPLVELAESRGF